MADKLNLNTQELEFISKQERVYGSFLKCIEELSKFKMDDVLIAFYPPNPYFGQKATREQLTNSYGAPKKYKIVHVDKNGVPYMKELNKNGIPAGNLIYPISQNRNYGQTQEYSLDYLFEVDPELIDAHLFDDMDGYNPTEVNKQKADSFKEIAKHNKELKIRTEDNVKLMEFIDSLVVGSKIWKSNTNAWTVTAIAPKPLDVRGKTNWNAPFITVVDHRNRILNLSCYDFKHKALYSGQPRTFRELHDPK